MEGCLAVRCLVGGRLICGPRERDGSFLISYYAKYKECIMMFHKMDLHISQKTVPWIINNLVFGFHSYIRKHFTM